MRKLVRVAMPVVAALALVVIGAPSVLRAAGAIVAPEIDPSTGLAAVALLAGAVLVVRGRRK
jgi:hypothetical protein